MSVFYLQFWELSGIKIVDVKCVIKWWNLERNAMQELSGTTVTLLYEYCQKKWRNS